MTNLKVAEGVLPPKGAAVKVAEGNKRKWDGIGKSVVPTPSQPAKKFEPSGSSARQKTGRYIGKHPKCNRCGYHHSGNCDKARCHRCNQLGHLAKDCRATLPSAQARTPTPAPAPAVQGTQGRQGCYNSGDTGHFKRDYPKLKQGENGKNGNGNGNNGGGGRTARAFVIGSAEARQDPDTVTGTFLLNDCYVSVLFDFGAVKS